MQFFKRLIDFMTLGSDRPIRRLLAYYIVLGAVGVGLSYAFPAVDRMFSGERSEIASAAPIVPDTHEKGSIGPKHLDRDAKIELAVSTTLICIATLALMLPVSWVYMSARRAKAHSQSIVQTLIILPIVVAGIILVVRNSLALAFSLAGVVSVLRFRTTLSDARDILYIFLAVAVGFAAGVQLLIVAVLLSVIFNFVLILIWRYDFGRNVLEPTAAAKWGEPLDELARTNGTSVPDRDLVLALTPRKAEMLTERFRRVSSVLGDDLKKPRFNAILTVTSNDVPRAQQLVEGVLREATKRWKLDEVVTNQGKPSELYYLIKMRKSTLADDLITALRARAGATVESALVETGDAAAREQADKKSAASAAT